MNDHELSELANDWLYAGKTSDLFPNPLEGNREIKTIGVWVKDGVLYHPSLMPEDAERLGLKVKIAARV